MRFQAGSVSASGRSNSFGQGGPRNTPRTFVGTSLYGTRGFTTSPSLMVLSALAFTDLLADIAWRGLVELARVDGLFRGAASPHRLPEVSSSTRAYGKFGGAALDGARIWTRIARAHGPFVERAENARLSHRYLELGPGSARARCKSKGGGQAGALRGPARSYHRPPYARHALGATIRNGL